MATLTTLQSVLKEFYAKAIAEQLNQEVLMLQLFEKAKLDWSGKRVIVPVHTARNTGVDFKSEGAALPTAGSQTYNELQINAKFLYGRFSLTGPAISSAKGAYSFGNYVDLELRRLTQDVRKKANESMFSGGGIVGYIQERKIRAPAAGVTDQFCGNAQQLEDLRVAAGGTVEVQFIRTDTFATVSVGGTGSTITAVDVDANTFTHTIGAAAVTTTFAVLSQATGTVYAVKVIGPAAATAIIGQEFSGINTNLSDTTHFNLNRQAGGVTALQCNNVQAVSDGNPDASYDSTNALSNLSLGRLQAIMDMAYAASGTEPNWLMMNPVHRSTYTALLLNGANNLFVDADKATKGDGGFTALAFNNVPFKTSVDCGKHIIYALNSKSWKLAELEKPGFANLDGNILSRSVNLDAYEGYYRMYMELYCERPNANGALVGFPTTAN